ncbi:MAG: class II glutamine amidotransferase [Candidatus Sericytochromatia bacterium]
MCRLYGIHAQSPGSPSYLVDSERSFARLSEVHKDGWGMAYYLDQEVHLHRDLSPAGQDPRFLELGRDLKTQTLIAHLRLATIGENRLDNNHPFQYQGWSFAHNGNIKHFPRYRQLILSQINPFFQAEIQGDTDSELVFYFLLSELERWGLVSNQYRHSVGQLGQTVKWGLENLLALIGPFLAETGAPTETYMSFLLTNGQVLLAHQGGQPLFYKHHPVNAEELENIIFCSEPIGEPENWHEMKTGELIAVDKTLASYTV